MDLSNLTRFRLRRVNPYRGLVIDEGTWAEAHDYHREHARLHSLAFHSEGVIAGLDVRPTPAQAGSVDVSPGIALDPEGNMIVVGQERRVPFDGVEPGLVYVLVRYQENRVHAEGETPAGATPSRIVESYKMEAANKLPPEPVLELARVLWKAPDALLRPAADPSDPQENEIDLRFRLQARVARPTPVGIGVVAGEADQSAPLRAARNLLREVDYVTGYQGRFRGLVDLEEGANGCDLILLRAPVASEAAVTTLVSHLGRGRGVIVDGCPDTVPAAEWQKAGQALAAKLGLKLAPPAPGDPLLESRYLFSEPPSGASDGAVLAAGRFVYSARDYGCAWSGACGSRRLPREAVRSALEWGVNLAIASVQPPA